MTYADICQRRRELHRSRLVEREAAEAAAAALYPSMSTRDIARNMGVTINFVDKDLRTLTGTQFKSPFKTKFCGAGDLTACRDSLWAAIDAAGAELATAQGSEDPAAWTSDANAERIKFQPGLLPFTMRYTNRPTGIQQLIEFKGHR